ncbi:MAG: FAD-dependent thymidylate synthase [Pigmentiphaga sp.]
MQVSILTHTPDMLRVIWTAARTCYSPFSPQELWESESDREEMLSLVRRIFKSGHLSVVEHCTITYAVSGVSRTLLAQYSRHRIGVSLSVQSQRHVSAASRRHGGIFPFVVPASIRDHPEAFREYREQLAAIQRSYEGLLELGINKEDARFLLPGGAATNFVTTVNLRSLWDIYQKRVVTPGAQWEIRDMVRTMAQLIIEREPWLAEFFPTR